MTCSKAVISSAWRGMLKMKFNIDFREVFLIGAALFLIMYGHPWFALLFLLMTR